MMQVFALVLMLLAGVSCTTPTPQR